MATFAPLTFKVPKEDREFWGSEFLSPDNGLTLACALDRLRKYVASNNLARSPSSTFFRADETIQRVLGTTRSDIFYSMVAEFLAAHTKHPGPIRTRDDDFCAASTTSRHSYGATYHTGNSAIGPVYARDCPLCGHTHVLSH